MKWRWACAKYNKWYVLLGKQFTTVHAPDTITANLDIYYKKQKHIHDIS